MTSGHDKRIPIRPYILCACFIWGGLCGFLYHIFRPTVKKDVEQPRPAPTNVNPTPTHVQIKPPEPVVPRAVMPPEHTGPATIPEEELKKAERDLLAQAPPKPPLPLNELWGLTGTTSEPPAATTKLAEPGPPALPANTNEIWQPIDDPELVF